ncbi:Mor transcription activator family protein [Nitrosospira sp. NpAV]|uniref:Mor transcription activator family protein n=1 Tax=Nitrosospira sp. NpAV TaxID=58133 RepID=UPI0006968D53|nr:Mor transcription activator family protein [Nitrosospira sp. NpAV]
MAEIDESLLPGILRDIAGLIGLPGTLTLVQHYGGVRLYIPKRFDPDHVLVKILGAAAVVKLIEHFGGEDHFDIPKALIASVAVRNAKIKVEYGELSQRQLALKYDLTERQVRNILAGVEEDDGQVALF